MRILSNELKKIRQVFLAPYSNCEPIIDAFCEDMKSKESLRMLNTFVFCSDERINGEYLSLDFGGSNVRISLYEVKDDGIKLKDRKSFSLRNDGIDYTTENYSLEDIFELAVDEMEKLVDPGKNYLLGHTFSFPMSAETKNNAKVIAFSKGFKIRNAVGRDINECLSGVISKRGLNIIPCAVLNDTTATLLTGFMMDRNTIMGCIVGTGHNMCFVNPMGEIINMESGGFNNVNIPLTEYDKKYLDKIPEEKHYLTEALVGGKNSAKLVSEVIDDIVSKGLIAPIVDISPKMMSRCLEGDIEGLDELQNYAIREVSSVVYERAAYLVASEILGVLRYSGISEGVYNVVFDGTVYEKTPYFGKCLTKILSDLLPEKIKVTHVLAKDASSSGAVIACAMDVK